MAEAMCELIKSWKDRGIITKFVQMDITGETICSSKEQVLAIGDTPLHNHLTELAFASLRYKGRGLLFHANAVEFLFSFMQKDIRDSNRP